MFKPLVAAATLCSKPGFCCLLLLQFVGDDFAFGSGLI